MGRRGLLPRILLCFRRLSVGQRSNIRHAHPVPKAKRTLFSVSYADTIEDVYGAAVEDFLKGESETWLAQA
jgi:hypothetical protein